MRHTRPNLCQMVWMNAGSIFLGNGNACLCCTGSRDVARAANSAGGKGWEVVFHKGQSEVGRPEAVIIAAGAAHSSAVTRDGVVLAWRSMDPVLQPQEVGGPLAGKSVTAISAGEGTVLFQ